MKCPSCSITDLVMAERQGIEIDYCPQCRGVWLDRGELDKIIERSHQTSQPSAPPSSQPAAAPVVQPVVIGHPGYLPPSAPIGEAPGPNFYWDGRKWKRKKSWFEEIFD
jgi:Zn-finger nucleic acid-binding protein